MKFALPDARLVSYPRSGRTWLSRMLTHVCHSLGLGCDELVMAKHDGAMIQNTDRCARNKRRMYRGRDVVLLVRDPRDVVVSNYFMLTVRHARAKKSRRFMKLSIGEFLHASFGLPHVVRFMNDWARQRDVPRRLLLVSYEELRVRPVVTLERVLMFLSVDVSLELIKKAVNENEFSRMQAWDRREVLPQFHLSKKERQRPEALAVRAGEVGGYVRHLSEEDQRYADDHIRENLDPWLGRYIY